MERTKIIFDARLSERPICPDIEQSLAQCYRYKMLEKSLMIYYYDFK